MKHLGRVWVCGIVIEPYPDEGLETCENKLTLLHMTRKKSEEQKRTSRENLLHILSNHADYQYFRAWSPFCAIESGKDGLLHFIEPDHDR